MKKFLSLVLALVMTMSLVTVSAGAKDFTDAEDITYVEAVEVMSAIKVVDGDAAGNFNPANGLTRGAAAKIICNLILGPTTAAELNADTNPYPDVDKDSTFAGYIAYCQKEGIISGYADGTFKPANPLTGYAFMKMLLGALGYDPAVEGYTGANWSINVAKQAIGIGLNAGLVDTFNGSDYVTREEAMLYAFNTLQATMVDYSQSTEVVAGDATVTIAGTRFDVEAGKKEVTINDDGKLQFAEKYFPKLIKTGTKSDVFDRPANEWKYKTEVIGLYTHFDTMVAEYTAKAPKGELYTTVGGSVVDKLSAAGTLISGETNYRLRVFVDGVETAAPVVANYFNKNDTGAAGLSGNGVVTQVFMDDNNNVTITMINTYLVQATADYNSAKEVLTIDTVDIGTAVPALPVQIENDDFDVTSYVEDDYLLITYSVDDDVIYTVEPAEMVTGTVTEWTENTDVYLDGVKYSYNKVADEVSSAANTRYTVTENATLVLDNYGYVIYVDAALANSNYLFVRAATTTSGLGVTAVADAYFVDGTHKEITLKKVDASKVATTMAGAQGWYNYTQTSDGTYVLMRANFGYKTEDVADGNTNGNLVENSKVKFLAGFTSAAVLDKGIKADDDTLFIVREADGEITVATGVANAPTVKTGANDADSDKDATISYITDKTGKYATKVFIDVISENITVENVANVADYMLLLKTTGNITYVDGSEYKQYKVLFDGEETTKYIETSVLSGMANNMGYNVKANELGYITAATAFANGGVRKTAALTDATITKSEKVLNFKDATPGTDDDFIVTADTKVYMVVGKGVTELLKNDSADYETYLNTTVSTLAGLTKDYLVDGNYYAVATEAGSEKLAELYVFITDVSAAPAPTTYGNVALTYEATNSGLRADLIDADSTTVKTVASLSADVDWTNIESGTYTLKLSKAGYVDYTTSVVVKDGKTTTVALPKWYDVTADALADFGAGVNTLVKAAVGSTVEVTAKNASAVLSTANTDITLVETKAPAATVKAEYSFVMPAKNVTTSFTETVAYTVEINGSMTSVAGLTIALDKTYVAAGGAATVTLSGTANATGTIEVGTSSDADVFGTLDVVSGNGYSKTFTVPVTTAKVSVVIAIS